MKTVEERLDLLENKLGMIDENLNQLIKEAYKAQELARNAKIDTEHMYRIVRQLHKEHKRIMQLNGHSTLLEVLDKLEE